LYLFFYFFVFIYFSLAAFLKEKDIMLETTELQIGHKVGEGSFAKVYDGMWGGYRVAVKKLRNVNITTNFFLREVANLQFVLFLLPSSHNSPLYL
jgi:hypothetical protein